jgi:hypothetical protein
MTLVQLTEHLWVNPDRVSVAQSIAVNADPPTAEPMQATRLLLVGTEETVFVPLALSDVIDLFRLANDG